MNYNDILNKFEIKHKSTNKAQCICPVHRDGRASLSVTYNSVTGKTLINCHAGCETSDILESVGLNINDLFDEELENKEDPNIEKVYKYTDEKGKILFEKVRFKDKYFSQRRNINGSTVWGLDEGCYTETFLGSNQYSKKDRNTNKKYFPLQEPILYNLPKVIDGVNSGRWVFIAEGEKDCNTLNSMGFIATTGSNGAGKGKWLDRYSKYFKGATVIILPDNDDPGKKYAEEVKRSIKKYAYSVRVVVVSDKEKGDISDWVQIEGNTRYKLIEIVKNIEEEHPPWFIKNKTNGNVKLNAGILSSHLTKELEYIIASSHDTRGLIHMYKNGVYKLASRNWVCNEISKYIPPHIRTVHGINNVAEMLTYKETINYDDTRGNENIINLKNGLYDIKTKELKPHSKNYISSYQLNCNYFIKEKIKNLGYWDNFINTLTGGNDELKNILQEYSGLTLSNIDGSRAKKALILHGKGDTGKSKYIDMNCFLVGKGNTTNIKIQQLSQRFSASSLYGKRIVFNGDLPAETLKDPSAFKEITGGDDIRLEFKGKDHFDYKFKGVCMFACNGLPYIKGDLGKHLFDRFLIVPCNNVIPKEKRDPFLIDKLIKDQDYIFQWALQGLERLLSNNFKFTHSPLMEEEKNKYMLQCDNVRSYIYENYTITNDLKQDKVKCSELYKSYENWCYMNNQKPCSVREFKNRMTNNLNIIIKKYAGDLCYRGLKRGN